MPGPGVSLREHSATSKPGVEDYVMPLISPCLVEKSKMDIDSVWVGIVRELGALWFLGILILQSACTPVQTAIPESPLTVETGARSVKDDRAVETTIPIPATVEAVVELQETERPPAGNPKLDSALNQLLEACRQGGPAGAQAFAETRRIVLDDGRVQVEVLIVEGMVDELREAIEAAGGEYQGHYETLLQALVPLTALESLAQRPDVEMIRLPRRAGP